MHLQIQLLVLLKFTFAFQGIPMNNDEKTNQTLNYRIAYPHPEDYVIEILVNPCGVNDTHVDIDETIPLGYDCCMNRYGRGEYGFLKYIPAAETAPQNLNHAEIFEKKIAAGPNEVLHNMILVDEDGLEIPYDDSRRADDHTMIDEKCRGLRDPYPSCIQKRLRAFKSPYVPSCWDHNQTIDSTSSCYTPNGQKSLNCMQVSYSQNAFINVCGGSYANHPNCGTFIEIHRSNGSPYDSEDAALSETKITNSETNGMTTTAIALAYKGNSSRILCAYSETKIRVGSMVRISDKSPQCCCPPKYNRLSQQGSYFCPRKKGGGSGPFFDSFHTILEEFQKDIDYATYPYCHDTEEDKDLLMCSRDLARNKTLAEFNLLEPLIGSGNSLYFTEKCQAIKQNNDNGNGGFFSSDDLLGEYHNACELGQTFDACGGIDKATFKCNNGDRIFNFRGRLGKVTRIPHSDKDTHFGVTFNDGRTEYDYIEEFLELEEPESNYELWFVQRNRFEKILQKRKGFRVGWPECTFDPINDRYFPYTII
jgi:hypothetical protein